MFQGLGLHDGYGVPILGIGVRFIPGQVTTTLRSIARSCSPN